MKDIIYSIIGGLLFSFVIAYILLKGGGSQIDPVKIEKIAKDVRKKPIADVIADVNEWLS